MPALLTFSGATTLRVCWKAGGKHMRHVKLMRGVIGASASVARHPGESRDPRTSVAVRVDPGFRRDDKRQMQPR